ncbi:MAG TPA: 2-aminoethylphosphonate--pyruvate transaminase [Chthoniobacterales bacterium]|nr:2-aminoethylphosphonate--pyruvate transaminase [Chthoniobacterales bacterium]
MKDSRLFTPGPLTTSATVKAAMQRDIGSREAEFIELVGNIRTELLRIAGVSKEAGYEAIPMQGSGTFAIESVLSSVVPPNGHLLILANGAYGERMLQIAERWKIPATIRRWPENESPDIETVRGLLEQNPRPTHVAIVHLETTTGILNPIDSIGRLVHQNGCGFIVDAMSSFGGVAIDLGNLGADYLISSPNKCLEGVPGFAFVIARRAALQACTGFARSVSLDLLAQWKGLEGNGQFRFTPPTHALLAFAQALSELREEGGVIARAQRYRANHAALIAGMRKLGFREFLPPEKQSCVITSFHYPDDNAFDFEAFYRRLADKGMIIYPGKVSQTNCFRIGTIGRISVKDVQALVVAIDDVLRDLGLVKIHG